MPAWTKLCDFCGWTLSSGGAHSGLSMHRHRHGLVPYQDVGTAPPRFTNPFRGWYMVTYSESAGWSLAHWVSDGYWPAARGGLNPLGMDRGSTPYAHRFAPGLTGRLATAYFSPNTNVLASPSCILENGTGTSPNTCQLAE